PRLPSRQFRRAYLKGQQPPEVGGFLVSRPVDHALFRGRPCRASQSSTAWRINPARLRPDLSAAASVAAKSLGASVINTRAAFSPAGLAGRPRFLGWGLAFATRLARVPENSASY